MAGEKITANELEHVYLFEEDSDNALTFAAMTTYTSGTKAARDTAITNGKTNSKLLDLKPFIMDMTPSFQREMVDLTTLADTIKDKRPGLLDGSIEFSGIITDDDADLFLFFDDDEYLNTNRLVLLVELGEFDTTSGEPDQWFAFHCVVSKFDGPKATSDRKLEWSGAVESAGGNPKRGGN